MTLWRFLICLGVWAASVFLVAFAALGVLLWHEHVRARGRDLRRRR